LRSTGVSAQSLLVRSSPDSAASSLLYLLETVENSEE
jgi:hypothetical protein